MVLIYAYIDKDIMEQSFATTALKHSSYISVSNIINRIIKRSSRIWHGCNSFSMPNYQLILILGVPGSYITIWSRDICETRTKFDAITFPNRCIFCKLPGLVKERKLSFINWRISVISNAYVSFHRIETVRLKNFARNSIFCDTKKACLGNEHLLVPIKYN